MPVSDIVIDIRHLSKQYSLGGPQEPYTTFRDVITKTVSLPMKILNREQKNPQHSFYALNNISFQVRKGEVIGIIGKNGAGKSTLLKILSRITFPTEGKVTLQGRVGSLLEVGTGFHPELTGRENIYLSGSILGMKKQEIDSKLDEIVKFSEIEKFLDTPVKRYSSGMYVRLAFAVAAHLEPEILLIDEVLAVGDIGFQKKCLAKMDGVAKSGRTVIFVSHNMAAISALCTGCVLLDHGEVIYSGNTQAAIQLYNSDIQSSSSQNWSGDDGDENARLLNVWIKSSNNNNFLLTTKAEIEIGIELKVLKRITGLIVGFWLYSAYQYPLIYSLYDDSMKLPVNDIFPGVYIYRFKIPKNTLARGTYKIIFDIGIHNLKPILSSERSLQFILDNSDCAGERYPVGDGPGRTSLLRPLWEVSVEFKDN
jgi:ABC-type polysaccharide/polyol phosphate transport system, ATPase component